MQGTYDTALVALSIAIAVLASYCALDLARRVTSNAGRWGRIWLIGGACSMGAGVWSMHFVGMLAFSMPIPLAYDVATTLGSLAIAVAASGVALHVASRPHMTLRQLLGGGTLMGIGICAMHYTGMAAMQMSPPIQYDPLLFAASVMIAICASVVALVLAFTLRGESGGWSVARRLGAAVIMGLAISGMHYTGMAAADFPPGSVCTVQGGLRLDGAALAYIVSFAILGLLVATLAISILDARLSSNTTRMLREVERANRDLTQEIERREQAQKAMRESQEQFQTAFENAPIGMVLYLDTDHWIHANPAMCRMLGRTEAELLELGYRGCVHPDDYQRGLRTFNAAIKAGQRSAQIALRYVHRDGHAVPVLVHVALQPNAPAGTTHIAQIEDITEREEMAFLAHYDPLTGLANRKLFLERLDDQLRSARLEGRQLAVAMIDLDHFKSINDAWGQAAGDRLLVVIAERLGSFTKSMHRLARIAGDRFALILTDVEDAAELTRRVQDQALAQIALPLTVFGQNLRISARAGVAMFPIDGEDAESLLRNAESALKHAKRGGESLCYYTRQISAAVRQRMEMENRLRHAIARNEFTLHYQPKLQLPDGKVAGVEALIRWNSPDMGMVPPQQFVPLLEETGLIRDVGLWTIAEALRASRAWSLLRGHHTPRIAVNVSSLQLQQPDFVGRVRELMGDEIGERARIDMEVTESLMLGEVESTLRTLNELRALGIRIAIDDFGTGYSSLTYLARLPVDALKIDRSFIIKMGDSDAHVAMVQTIVTMARSLHLTVIAEGVDSIEQLRQLRQLGCDEVQGFLFSRPVPFSRLGTVVDALRLPSIGTPAEETSRPQRA